MGGEIMERDIITVYCLIDEYLKLSGIKDDVRAEISNAEVLLIGYMAVNDFNGNYFKAHQYVGYFGTEVQNTTRFLIIA